METVAASWRLRWPAGTRPSPRGHTSTPPASDHTRAGGVELLGEIDDGLAALGTDRLPEPLLTLRAPIRAALERQLEAHSLASVRMWVHRAAWDKFQLRPTPGDGRLGSAVPRGGSPQRTPTTTPFRGIPCSSPAGSHRRRTRRSRRSVDHHERDARLRAPRHTDVPVTTSPAAIRSAGQTRATTIPECNEEDPRRT